MSPPFPDGAAAELVAAAALRDTASAPYGLTDAGFAPKPYGRLVAEGLALARELFGPSLDLEPGSVVRKLVELSALEDARTWAALARAYDDCFVATARGAALSALGDELGLMRPFLEAEGTVTLALGELPDGVSEILLPAGARLLTEGGHHVALAAGVRLGRTDKRATVTVRAFWPGPETDLRPDRPGQTIVRWNPLDPELATLRRLAAAENVAPEALVRIQHDPPAAGRQGSGDRLWGDERYRRLLLGAPRSIWTQDAIRTAVSLVPGVRAAMIKDSYGGIDVERAIFGDMTFLERVFSPGRDLASAFGFLVIVAPMEGTIWDGEDGLAATVLEVIEDIRPIGVVPEIVRAQQVGVGISASLVVKGLPLPAGGRDAVNASEAAAALKRRLLQRLARYVETLGFGEPVRSAQIVAAFLAEPGIEDVRDLRIVRTPASDPARADANGGETLGPGANLPLRAEEIAVAIDDPRHLAIA